MVGTNGAGQFVKVTVVTTSVSKPVGAVIFERGSPEATIYKILERGGPKSLNLSHFLINLLQIFHQKGGGLGPCPKSATVRRVEDPISMVCI